MVARVAIPTKRTAPNPTNASISPQNPATQQRGEAVLLEIRSHPSVLNACQHIIQHSISEGARFHAVLALRDAALRQWLALPAVDRDRLILFAIQAAVQ